MLVGDARLIDKPRREALIPRGSRIRRRYPRHALNKVLNAGQPGQPAQPPHGCGDLNPPSVWRSARTQAAAEVEASSSTGVDEIEIPAFLRKPSE